MRLTSAYLQSLIAFSSNYFPMPYENQISIAPEHEAELLYNKHLRDIYLDNKHYFCAI
jgi:hypothetical protein